ncbi:unnamed protein product [Arabidopsis arenosa]|uniref:Uncharacterized protein n=1 Tax=Arabidopsis arenosa TaxID=38785 RepID=A0A8S2A3F9_ARAAE|nr:unnamed protein product [Arabidopsis arenosa]
MLPLRKVFNSIHFESSLLTIYLFESPTLYTISSKEGLDAGTALLLVASYTSLSVLDPTNLVFDQDKKNKKEISDPSFEHVREYVLIDLEKFHEVMLDPAEKIELYMFEEKDVLSAGD